MAVVGGPDEIVTDGLVLHLDAANPQSYPGTGTTWYDLSGNGNHGTLTNGPTFGGRDIVLDGINDFITLNTVLAQETLNSSTKLTISLWLKPDRYGIFMPFSTGQTGNDRIYYWTQSNKNTWRVNAYTTTDDHTVLPANIKWYNTVLVIDGLNLKVYLNGLEDYTGTYTTFTTHDYVHLGKHGVDSSYYYDGKLGKIVIYNKALTSEEILQNYNATKERFTNK